MKILAGLKLYMRKPASAPAMTRLTLKASADASANMKARQDSGNAPHAGAKPVHIIDQIERIGNPHDPEQGGHGIQCQ